MSKHESETPFEAKERIEKQLTRDRNHCEQLLEHALAKKEAAMETLYAVADFLQIDFQSARKSEGKPSDVYKHYIAMHIAEAFMEGYRLGDPSGDPENKREQMAISYLAPLKDTDQ